ncbi:hypothetical protein, partial [Dapis sp. BLCC M229]|uniref:hypothetical protein n=1 Tax=Dapis sp. BLCC M229 TaxID=3400188 RepID=UPI003CE7A5C0
FSKHLFRVLQGMKKNYYCVWSNSQEILQTSVPGASGNEKNYYCSIRNSRVGKIRDTQPKPNRKIEQQNFFPPHNLRIQKI